MKRMELISIVNQILDCTDKMSFGSSSKSGIILGQLGYEFIDPMDVADIDFMMCEMAPERGYILDKSHHDGEIMGLPQVYDFVKKRIE